MTPILNLRATLWLRWAVLAVLTALSCHAQAIRFDSFTYTTNAGCVSGRFCPVLATPNATVKLCIPPACASRATTYTDTTAATTCPSLAQLTPATGGACLSGSDNQGNWGAWILPGNYNYYVTMPANAGGTQFGPYPISIHGDSGGYTFDANYATMALACAAAGSGTLLVSRPWTSMTTANLSNCNMAFTALGKLQPAAGQTITLKAVQCPATQQCFDISLGGTVTVTGGGDIQMVWWGADPSNTTDSTLPIQAALNSSTGGQITRCAKGVYKVTATLTIPSYLNWSGPSTDYKSGQSLSGGCMLKWAGSSPASPYLAGSFMVEGHGVYGTHLDGINMDGANTPNLGGYLIAGDTTASQRNSYNHFLLTHFGVPASNIAGAGIQLGTGGAGDQPDGGDFGPFYMVDVTEGFRFESPNIAYTTVHNCAIAETNVAFHIISNGFSQVNQCTAGTMEGLNPKLFWITGVHGIMEIAGTQAELFVGTGVARDLVVDFQQLSPIFLHSNVWLFGSDINQNSLIISDGNQLSGTWNVGSSTRVFSTGDLFVGANGKVVKTVNGRWYNLGNEYTGGAPDPSTGVAIQQIDGDFNVGSILNFNQTAASGITTSSNQYTTNAGYKWNEIWSGSLFGIRDQTASNFVPFSIDSGLSGAAGLFLHQGYTKTQNTTIGNMAAPPPAGSYGIGFGAQGQWLWANSPTTMMGYNQLCMSIGPNTSPVGIPNGCVATLLVNNIDDSGATKVIVRASSGAQGTTNLAEFQDSTNAPRTIVKSTGRLNFPGYPGYASNALALAGGLVAGDLYTVSGTSPLQLAVVF